jgi:hypothetical protein
VLLCRPYPSIHFTTNNYTIIFLTLFIGDYNKGPRNYYGPRYFVFGRLFNKEGTLWYEGTFNIGHSLIGYPLFRKEESFKDGTEFNNDGTVKRNYINGTVK